MFRFPLTTKTAEQVMPTPAPMPAMPTPTISATPAVPQPAPSMNSQVAGNGGGGTRANKSVPTMPPGAKPTSTVLAKTSQFKLSLYAPHMAYPPIQQQQPRTGLINATIDTGKDYLDGLGQYGLDVLQENTKRTQRPNDPRILQHHSGAL